MSLNLNDWLDFAVECLDIVVQDNPRFLPVAWDEIVNDLEEFKYFEELKANGLA
jgi:hypothetical protein